MDNHNEAGDKVDAPTAECSSEVPRTSNSDHQRPMTAQKLDEIRTANFGGFIPVVLTLASTSLSSPTLPAPIHVLVSRNTFLHSGLEEAIRRLHTFAPATFSFQNRVVQEAEPGSSSDEDEKPRSSMSTTESSPLISTAHGERKDLPACWFEDEETDVPLRWQLFVGVLFDSMHKSSNSLRSSIPWKIRLHFTNYPSSQLLELDQGSGVTATVQRTFKHSLKQALSLQHGHSKVALNMTKQSHEMIWEAMRTAKFSALKLILREIQTKTDADMAMVPVRLIVGSSNQPIMQKRCNAATMTLGQLLMEWIPTIFTADMVASSGNSRSPQEATFSLKVAGISPPLDSQILQLWRSLSHPDNFLYICVLHDDA